MYTHIWDQPSQRRYPELRQNFAATMGCQQTSIGESAAGVLFGEEDLAGKNLDDMFRRSMEAFQTFVRLTSDAS